MMPVHKTKSHKPASRRARSRRKGVLTLEAMLVLPILILVTLAGVQFGIIMVVEQAITHSATVAAREAGKGADVDLLVCVVEKVLAPHGITIGEYAGVVLEDPTADLPVDSRGLACQVPAGPVLNGDEVRVTVCVDLSKRPFLNALRSFCIDFTGRRFVVSSVVKKEFDFNADPANSTGTTYSTNPTALADPTKAGAPCPSCGNNGNGNGNG